MEPLKINIEVSLSKETLAVLRALVGAKESTGFDIPAPQPEPEQPKRRTKKTEPAPAPEAPQPDPAPSQADDDDLPPDDAPAPEKKPTPSEADARAAVKAAKDRGVSPKVIRSYMQESFGIASSVDCPAERRQELIEGLNKLAA